MSCPRNRGYSACELGDTLPASSGCSGTPCLRARRQPACKLRELGDALPASKLGDTLRVSMGLLCLRARGHPACDLKELEAPCLQVWGHPACTAMPPLPTGANRSTSCGQRWTRAGRVGYLPWACRAPSLLARQRRQWLALTSPPGCAGGCHATGAGRSKFYLLDPNPTGLGTLQGLLSCARAPVGATRSPCLCPAPSLAVLGARPTSECMGFFPLSVFCCHFSGLFPGRAAGAGCGRSAGEEAGSSSFPGI